MMAQEAGMRVLLHRQGETPQMEDYGFNAATGLRTSVAMSYVCILFSSKGSLAMSGVVGFKY